MDNKEDSQQARDAVLFIGASLGATFFGLWAIHEITKPADDEAPRSMFALSSGGGCAPCKAHIEQAIASEQATMNASWSDGDGDDGDTIKKLRGEWWFDESGNSLFADGDVGEMNHESYVIDTVVRDILSHLGIDYGDDYVGDLGEYVDEIAEKLGDEDYSPKDLDDALADLYLDPERRKDAIDAANGRSDARDYAVQWLGWKRVKGNNIQTWTLTPHDFDAIINGIYDAAGGAEIHPEAEFSIEIDKTREFYMDVPFEVLKTKSLFKMRPYKHL